MSQEKILSDYSGGMNALAAVDKLDPKECLLAENVRLDETGNILSAGAFTRQNTSTYADASGSSKIHSLYWNPSLGSVAGVGKDVFIGATLGGLSSKLVGKNMKPQKMSFASAPSRVYFDVGNVGYWTDMTNLLTVDWPPPSSSSAITTGPNLGSTATQVGFGSPISWTNPGNAVSTTAFATASYIPAGGVDPGFINCNGFGFSLATATPMQGIQTLVNINADYVPGGTFTRTATLTITQYLIIAGVPTGATKTQVYYSTTGTFDSFIGIATFGNANDLWSNPTLTPAQVNAGNFGVGIDVSIQGANVSQVFISLNSVKITAFQQATGFVVGTGTTGTLTGTYSYKVTFVGTNGEESDGSIDSTNVILSAQQGTLTAIPVGDARTASRNIYRKGYAASTPLTLHYLVGSIPDNSTTTFSDNQTDIAAITEGVILAGDVPGDFPNSRLGATTVRFPVYHYDRVFWVSQLQPNQILWSKPLNGFAYPAVNSIDVGDSKPITRLISIFGELIIFKTGGQIWRLTGTDESSFDLTQTPSSIGTDESFTAAALPDKIPFANRFGLWVFNGYTSQPLTTKLDLWFKQDDRTGEELFGVNGFHPPEVQNATVPLNFEAVGNSEKYVLAYAEAGQTQNNALLVFDLKHGNITKRTGLNPLSLAIDEVTGYVYVGDSSGFISLLDDWNGATNGGGPVNFDFQTGYMDFQRGSNKAIWALEFLIDTDGQQLTPTVYYDNGDANEVLAPISATAVSRVVRTLESQNSRKAQNFSVGLNGSINPVNKSGSPQIQIIHIKAFYDIRTGRARTGQ